MMPRIDHSSTVVTISMILAIATTLLAATPVGAQANDDADRWNYEFAIYGWLPDIEGTLTEPMPGTGNELKIDAQTLLDNLEMTAQLAFEAKRGRWGIVTDVVYLSEEAQRSGSVEVPQAPGLLLNTDARLDLTSWIAGVTGVRTLADGKRGNVDLLFGVRYFNVDTDLELQIQGPLPPELSSASFSSKTELWDGVVGIRGKVRLGEHWFVPYRLDAGAGDSDLTWQAFAGIGYRFGWGSLFGMYRSLNYDQGSDKALEDFTFAGPAVAVTFRF